MKQRTFDSFLFKYKKNTQIFFDLSVQIKKTRERKKKLFCIYLQTIIVLELRIRFVNY